MYSWGDILCDVCVMVKKTLRRMTIGEDILTHSLDLSPTRESTLLPASPPVHLSARPPFSSPLACTASSLLLLSYKLEFYYNKYFYLVVVMSL